MNNPSLRFTSLNQADWYSTCLSDVVDIVGGGTPSTSQDDYWNGDVQWFTPSEITQKYVTESSRTITEEGVNNSSARYLPQGTILFTSRASLGLSSINVSPKKVTTNQGFQSLIPKEGWLSEFVYYLVNNRKFIQEVENRASGSTFKEISLKNLKSITLLVPSDKTEQQKIAAFFTALDEKITLAEKALALTERTTKVLLGKIYKGEFRFKQSNGASFPDWQVRKLDQLLKFQNGINTSKEQFGKGIKLISVKEVLSDVPVTYDSIASSVEVDDKEAKRFCVEYGDIVFQRSSETAEEAGSANVYLDPRPAVFGGFVIRGKKIADYHPQFLKMALRSKQVRRQIVRLAQGAQHVNIGQEQLSSVEVQLPCLAEQEKIAELITNFEHKKSTVLAKLNKLKRLKQAFMQQMFV